MLMKETFTLHDSLMIFLSNPFNLIIGFIILGSMFVFYLSPYYDKLESFIMRKLYNDHMTRRYNLHQLRTDGERITFKFLCVLGALFFSSMFFLSSLTISLLDTLIDNISLGVFLFVGAIILYMIVFFGPLIYFFGKIERRCTERMNTIVIDAITNRLIEDKKQSDEVRMVPYKIGISLLEFNKFKEQYPLRNPMNYINKAIQKANS